MKRWFVLTGLLLMCLTPAHAASFDCAKAQRPVEKAICGNKKLSLADETLGHLYRDALAKLSSGSVRLLRVDQVQWLAWVQQICRANEPSTTAASAATCLLPLYTERNKLLHTAVVRRDGVTFLTRTQYLAAPNEKGSEAGEHPGFGTLEASWPVADSVDPLWLAWSESVERSAYLMVADGDAKCKTAPNTPAWNNSLAEEQDTQITVQVKSLEHGRATTAVNLESMGHGAAHPNEAFETHTWLLEAKRALQADDVFQAGSQWRAPVAAACWKALSTGAQKDSLYDEVKGPDAKPLQDAIGDIHNWTLEPDGLHISYPEYGVAPRASPVDDTVIPWQQIKPVLAPGFLPPSA